MLKGRMATNAHGQRSCKSVYKGASQDLSSGLRLVAQMRRPRTSKSFRLTFPALSSSCSCPFNFMVFWREFDGLVQEINAPPTLREVILKLNLLPGRYCCKKHDHEGQLCVRVTAMQCCQKVTHNHARCGRSPKMPCSSLRRNAPVRCTSMRRIVPRSGKPYNGTGHRQCSLGCTWICLRAALKSKLAPTKDECVSSGRNARRTSEAIGRLMRSGHTVLSKTSRGPN